MKDLDWSSVQADADRGEMELQEEAWLHERDRTRRELLTEGAEISFVGGEDACFWCGEEHDDESTEFVQPPKGAGDEPVQVLGHPSCVPEGEGWQLA